MPAVKSLSTSPAGVLQWHADPWPRCSGTIDEWGGSSVWVMWEKGLRWCVYLCTCVCGWLSECALIWKKSMHVGAYVHVWYLCVTIHSDSKKKTNETTTTTTKKLESLWKSSYSLLSKRKLNQCVNGHKNCLPVESGYDLNINIPARPLLVLLYFFCLQLGRGFLKCISFQYMLLLLHARFLKDNTLSKIA